MIKKFLSLILFLVLSLVIKGQAVEAISGPTASISSYNVSELIISPDNSTSVGAQDTSDIDLVFTGPVDVDMEIKDSGDNVVKHFYNTTADDTFSRVWKGTDASDNFVADGIYTIQIVYADAGGVATDTSKTITIDNTSPIVGPIVLTPSISTSTNIYIGPSTTISASSTDTNINSVTCRYSIDGGSSSIVNSSAYDVSTNSCIFPDIDTSSAVSIAVSVNDLAGNSFDTSSSWVAVFIDSGAPIITLLGESTTEISVGSTYIDAGASALDSVEGDLSSSVIMSGTVDTSTIGDYLLTYNVTDSLGNVATPVTRTVRVVANPVSSGGGTGYIKGYPLVQLIETKATSTGLVLGTSTEKTKKLTKEERHQRILKKRLNRLKIKLYDLKHPVVGQNLTNGTSTVETGITPNSGVGTSSGATTTNPKKPFWKFW